MRAWPALQRLAALHAAEASPGAGPAGSRRCLLPLSCFEHRGREAGKQTGLVLNTLARGLSHFFLFK